MYQMYEKKVREVFIQLKKLNKVLIYELSENFEFLPETWVKKAMKIAEKNYEIIIPEEYYPYYLSVDNLKLRWNIDFGEYMETGGEIYITNITGMFVNPLTTFDKNNIPPHEAKLLKQGYRFFDYRSSSGDMAAIKIQNNQIEPNVYWVSAAEEPLKLSVSYPEYMEHILKLRGLHFWQYLFAEIALDEVDFNLEAELEERLPYLTMLFPDEDFSEYFERFNEMKAIWHSSGG